MTILEDIISFTLLFISTMSPSSETSLGDFGLQENYPHVYVVAKEDLAMSVCGCPCDVGGLYVGKQNIDGVIGRTVIVGGNANGYLYLNDNWSSGLYHELIHLRQDIEGKMDFAGTLDEDELTELHVELEKEAYSEENLYRIVKGLPPHDLSKMSNHSTELTTGQAKCFEGYSPIPKEERPRLLDLIEFYDDGMIDTYRNKWQ